MSWKEKIIIGIVVIIVSLVIIYLWLIPPPPRPIIEEQECRARLTHKCILCKNMNWTVKLDIDENLQTCKEKYWSDLMIVYKTPINFDDCSVMEQFCYEMVGDVIE